MNNSSEQHELLKLADAYVCGALDAAESEHFEQRLLEDQHAREAVANAVELVTVTRAALAASDSVVERAPAAVPGQTGKTSSTGKAFSKGAGRNEGLEWAVTIACICLVVFGLAFGVSRKSSDVLVQDLNRNAAGGELALIWGEMITSDAGKTSGPETVTVDDLLNGFEERDLQISDSPDWMLAAVGELSARDDMDHERDMENR